MSLGALTFFWLLGDGCWWPHPFGPLAYIGAERGAAGIVWRTGPPPPDSGWMLELAATAPRAARWIPLTQSFGTPGSYRAFWVPLWLPWCGLATLTTGCALRRGAPAV